MKTKIGNYTFNKTAKTVTFTDYSSVRLDGLLIITNVTDNLIIYNFADPTAGGTVLGNVLTLTYDTSTMSDTDKLLIYYDDSDYVTTEYFALIVNELLDAIANPSYVDKAVNAIRNQVVSGTITTVGTVTTLTTLTTASNLVNVDSQQGRQLVVQTNDNAWANCNRALIT